MSHEAIDAQRLTLYCTETDRHGGRPLYEWLTDQALDQALAGVTVHGARSGFGRHRRMHHQRLLSISDDLPVIVELIDTAERIDAYLAAVSATLVGYTFTREPVQWHRPE